MKVIIKFWKNEEDIVPSETRQETYALARAMGENAGFYKVQAIQPGTGIVITEWKQPLC